MKKKNILALALAAVYILAAFAGCKKAPENGDNSTSSGGENVQLQEYTLVENGKSEYTIVIPNSPTFGEDIGADIISEYLYQATACSMKIVSESAYNSAIHKNTISLGKTELYNQTNLNVNVDDLNTDGYVIKNVGEDIYVVGGESGVAYQYAAYRLLNEFIDFEAYSYDEIYYKSARTVVYEEMDIVDIPDFAFREMYNEDVSLSVDPTAYRNLIKNHLVQFSSVGGGHSIFKLLPVETYYEEHKDWYVSTDPARGQLCFSKQDMVEELARQVINEVKNAGPAVTHVMVAQNDGREWCTCTDCTASLVKYGTNSAVLVKAINYIAREVQKYIDQNEPGRKIKVCTFAYTSTEVPPTKVDERGNIVPFDDSVKLEDNVSIRLAPIDTNYARSYYDWENEPYAKNIAGWGVLAKEIIVWNYNTNFNFLFVPFCSWNSIQDNYKFFKSCNVNAVMEQGARKQVGFMALKNYLYSKLMWDNDADFEMLIDTFFDNYFRDGSEYMKKYFDEYRSWYNVIEAEHNRITGSIYAGYGSVEDVFPLSLMDKWEGYVNQAKQEIEYIKNVNPELYQKLYERMDKESLFFASVRLFWYETSYSSSQLLQMRLSFKEKCEYYGISHFSNTKPLSETYTAWGI